MMKVQLKPRDGMIIEIITNIKIKNVIACRLAELQVQCYFPPPGTRHVELFGGTAVNYEVGR